MTFRLLVMLCCFLSISIFPDTINAQSTINSCSETSVDPGGLNADYPPNSTQLITYCSDQQDQSFMRIQFFSLDLGQGDRIRIFDGPDTNAVLLRSFGSGSQNQAYVLQSSVNNPSGCLTLSFQSNGIDQGTGWEAKVSCIDSCQTILAQIDSILPIPQNNFVDICQGERVFFFGSAEFPESGILYEHSAANSVFEWDFGDGTYAIGENASHIYSNPGGYTAKLRVVDPFGCSNAILATQNIRVSGMPNFILATDLDGPYCVDDTISVSSSLNVLNNQRSISVLANEFLFDAPEQTITEAPIPDGSPAPLVSELVISAYESGATIQSPTDFPKVCLNLEHSRLQDLDIELICPNGQSIKLHENTGFTTDPTFLGSPTLGDEGRVVPGTGGLYCWSIDGAQSWNTVLADSNLTRLPIGEYAPQESFSDLIGCPLNGVWSLSVRDTQTTANGYLFNWSIGLNVDQKEDSKAFEPQLISQTFTFEPNMVFYQQDTLAAPADLPGDKYYQLEVMDAFGCTYDGQVKAQIRAQTSPECLSCEGRYQEIRDTFLCVGDSLTFNVDGLFKDPTRLTFTTDPKYRLGFGNHPPENPYRAQLLVEGVAQDSIRNPFTEIASVCVTIESDFDEDLAIFLRAPDGRLLELSTNNGGGFDNYTNTCFTPSARNPITSGSPPFRGDFSPEGSWGSLVGAPTNGVWELVVSDAFDLTSYGRVLNWDITFVSNNEIEYTWSPADGLSCTDCPNPKANPSENTTYRLDLLDSYGCSFSDVFEVTVLENYPAPNLICGPLRPGEMIFSWDALGPNLPYEGVLTINGVDSILAQAITDTFLIVDNLVFGDEVGLRLNVMVQDTLYPCFVGVAESTCVFEDCFTFTRISRQENVDCFGEATGLLEVTALRGFRPFTYYLNGDFVGQQDSLFTGLTAGDYSLVTEDMTGCSDTLTFSISQPPPIVNSLIQLDSIVCFGDSTATISAESMGGTGDLTLSWNYPLVDSLTFLEDLPAGNYVLSTSDSLGCTVQDSLFVIEPPSILIDETISPISCAGDADGIIIADLSGGTGDLSFQWNIGINDTMLINLGPGSYIITVTDESACTQIEEYVLEEPLPLSLDTIILQDVTCFGRTNGQAELMLSGGTMPYNYIWLDSLSQTSSRASNLPGGLVEVRVTDDRGCLITEFVDVPEPEPLVVDFSIKMVSCLGGADATAEALVMGGNSPYEYFWQNGSENASLGQLARGNYNLTVTDRKGCINENTVSITEPSTELVVGAAQDLEGCFGTSQNEARAIATGGGDSQYEYLWSDGQTTAVAIELDSLIYTVTITDNNGCAKTSSIKLNDLPKMVPNTIINSPTCFGFSDGAIGINFIEGRPGADLNRYQFLWNTGQRGAAISNLVGDSLYTVTVTDPNGCNAQVSKFVRQPKLITFQARVDDASCFGLPDGRAEIINISAETAQFRYNWDDRAANQTGVIATNLAAGVYTVTVSDELNCQNLAQVTVGQPTQINVSFDKQDNTCFGDQTGAIEVSATGGRPDYRFAWSNGQTGERIEGVAAGLYMVTTTDASNCFVSTTVQLEQPDAIDITVNTQDVSCAGDQDGTIQILTNGGAPPYRFSVDRINFNGSPVIVGLGAGDYNVSIRDANDCSFLVTASILEPPQMNVDAGPAQITLPFGDSITLQANAEFGQGSVVFEWVEPFPGALPCLFCDSVTVSPPYSVAYELIGLDSVGCQASDFVNIFVEKEQFIAVPTGFTPNDDGRNDRLLVHGDPSVRINVFQVYDRLGELVYEIKDTPINDPSLGWDGWFKTEQMPQDTYIWYIEATFNGQRKAVFRGQTTLIR